VVTAEPDPDVGWPQLVVQLVEIHNVSMSARCSSGIIVRTCPLFSPEP
jgi:hypothetical protein